MIKVGVIGVGNIGYHHARVYSTTPGVKLVCVCDSDERRGKEVASRFNCRYYKDYRQMLSSEELQAISLAVPTTLHYSIGAEVLQAGINMLIEKPLAHSVEQASQLIQLAKRFNVIMAVGHVERYNPAVMELKRLISSGQLGEITSIVAKRVGMLPPQVKDSNVILDLATHDIDVINFLLDREPTDVVATAGMALLDYCYDHSEIFLKYENIGCFVQVNWITPVKIRTLSVTGTQAYAELNYVSQELCLFEINLEKTYTDFGDFVVKFGESRSVKIPITVKEPLRCEIECFLHAIQGGNAPIVTGEEALKALKVVERVLSALKGKTSNKGHNQES